MRRQKSNTDPPPLGLDDKTAKEATGSENRAVNVRLITQAVEALWLPKGLDAQERLLRIKGAIALLQGIKPADELEGMLAAQMVATHTAAMECLRRAVVEGQTFEGRDQNLKHAAKLLAIYTSQLDALNKHRGKGQQKVTVEHVHVEAGGQAVVGHVDTGHRAAQSAPPPKAIPHSPAETLDVQPQVRTKVAKPRPNKASS